MKLVSVFLLIFVTSALADESVPADIIKAEFEKANKEFTDEDSLLSLAKQVESLKNRVVVQAATNRSTQAPKNVKVKGATTVFNYRSDSIYDIYSGVDFVTDIRLKPGESLTTSPTAGDTVRWNLTVMKSGEGDTEQTHLIVKPLEDGIETNLIVTTNEHIYQFKLHGTDFHMPSVTFNYPQDKAEFLRQMQERKSREEPVTAISQLVFDYEVTGRDYPWKPLRVFNDGKKTYIQMPDSMRVSEAPVLFVLDSEATLTNYRVKGSYYIVDRLFQSAELRVGKNDLVEISPSRKKNFFERIF